MSLTFTIFVICSYITLILLRRLLLNLIRLVWLHTSNWFHVLLLTSFDLLLDALWHLFVVTTGRKTVLGWRDGLAKLFVVKFDAL